MGFKTAELIDDNNDDDEVVPVKKKDRKKSLLSSFFGKKKVEEEKVTPEIEFVDAVTLVQTQAEDGAYQVYVVH